MYKRTTKTWHTPYFVLFFRKEDTLNRVGFVAGKKVGNAVARNRAKRLLRAHFLTQIDSLSPGQYVFVAKASLIGHPFEETAKAFVLALKRAGALSKSSV